MVPAEIAELSRLMLDHGGDGQADDEEEVDEEREKSSCLCPTMQARKLISFHYNLNFLNLRHRRPCGPARRRLSHRGRLALPLTRLMVVFQRPCASMQGAM